MQKLNFHDSSLQKTVWWNWKCTGSNTLNFIWQHSLKSSSVIYTVLDRLTKSSVVTCSMGKSLCTKRLQMMKQGHNIRHSYSNTIMDSFDSWSTHCAYYYLHIYIYVYI